MEEDRLDSLPAPVYVRGYIRAYCASLGESPVEPLRLYEERLQSLRPAPPPAPATPSGGVRGGAVLALIVVLLILGGALYLFANPSTLAPLSGDAAGSASTAAR
jgi:cytoskeletal protein RodZ